MAFTAEELRLAEVQQLLYGTSVRRHALMLRLLYAAGPGCRGVARSMVHGRLSRGPARTTQVCVTLVPMSSVHASHSSLAHRHMLAGCRQTPNKPCPLEKLKELGVLYWKLDADNWENDPRLAAIRKVRNYSYMVGCGSSCSSVSRQERQWQPMQRLRCRGKRETAAAAAAAGSVDRIGASSSGHVRMWSAVTSNGPGLHMTTAAGPAAVGAADAAYMIAPAACVCVPGAEATPLYAAGPVAAQGVCRNAHPCSS
jgi:hypothetical protein